VVTMHYLTKKCDEEGQKHIILRDVINGPYVSGKALKSGEQSKVVKTSQFFLSKRRENILYRQCCHLK